MPRRSVEAFSSGDATLPVNYDGYVRMAHVIVRLCDRHAVEVLGVEFLQDRAIPNGTLDLQHHRTVMASGVQLLEGDLVPTGGESVVVDARHRFAKRRLDHLARWEPTEADVSALRRLVNLRADRELL
jgi:hypothetical protein